MRLSGSWNNCLIGNWSVIAIALSTFFFSCGFDVVKRWIPEDEGFQNKICGEVRVTEWVRSSWRLNASLGREEDCASNRNQSSRAGDVHAILLTDSVTTTFLFEKGVWVTVLYFNTKRQVTLFARMKNPVRQQASWFYGIPTLNPWVCTKIWREGRSFWWHFAVLPNNRARHCIV